MPSSPLPNPLSDLGARRFSFYPAIRNIEHNEWQFRRATWQELIVVNTSTGEEAFIPRASVGEVSIIDDPVVIVGLRTELEWREGVVFPHQRRVIEFPAAIAVNDTAPMPSAPSGRLAPVVNIRLEPAPASKKSTKIAVGAMLGALGCLIAADIAREIQTRQRSEAFRRSVVRLSYQDGYSAIVSRFGLPAGERNSGDYQVLFYPERRVSLVLKSSRYVGAVASDGRIVDSVSLPDGASSDHLLRSIPPF